MFIDYDIKRFIISINKSVKEAISLYGDNKGLPLIAINDKNEFIGTLSNGDIRVYLSESQNNIEYPIIKAVNTESIYCFDNFDKSIFEHILSNEKIKILPIIDKYKKLKAVAYYDQINFKISNKIINYKSNYTYLIAEIGVNHNGKIKEAIDLIDNISNSGFDAVKMQFRSCDTYSNIKSNNDIDLGTEYILSELDRVRLSYDQEKKIIEHIKRKKLDFIGTPFDNKSLERLLAYKPDAIKIASCDITNIFLIKNCAKYNLPIILSTGMSNETEIIRTNQLLEDLNVNRCFLHCNSTYPTPIDDVNLSYINRLGLITNCIIGYSSHDGNKLIPLASIASGAKIVELHVTKDKNARGTDHIASISLEETEDFIQSARKISLAKGSASPRVPSQGELMNKIPLGKSLCYSNDFKKGYQIKSKDDFLACSPGDGIPVIDYKKFENKILKIDVKKLDKVDNYHFKGEIKKEKFTLSNFSKNVLSEFLWGIPVRYRDIEKLNNLFNPPLLEIHLSSRDLEFDIKLINKSNLTSKIIVVHAIEQYHDGFLLDLASENNDINDESLKRFDNLIIHCKRIKDYLDLKNKIKIVLNCGGFSRYSFCDLSTYKKKKKILYQNLNNLKNKYSDFNILPQTMPPFPWHQGGTSYHNLLRSSKDIKELNKETGLKICFDFSHTYMESKYSSKSFNNNFLEIIPFADHLHLSDSSSLSNEGLNIDDGNIDFKFTLDNIFKTNNNKEISFIPEVWQGHLNDGEGFKISLERIASYLS